MKGRWQKLIWNVPFNGLGAALDLATDQLLATEAGTQLVSSLMHEIMAASAALNMPFDDPDAIVQHQLAETRDMARYHTSMQLDRRHNRPLEHEAIIGQPLRRGTTANTPMPHTAHLYQLLSMVNAPPAQALKAE
jgi:2-dehydropantoate 2-reductase